MKKKCIQILLLASISSTIFGCAKMPDAIVNYYLPESKVVISANQTVSCIDESNPIVKTDVTFVPIYSANLNQQKTIDFSKLDTLYAGGEATLVLTDDGRLSSFNTTATGVGGEVIDTIISLIDILGVREEPAKSEDACKIVNKLAGKTKDIQNPLSIVLTSMVTFSGDNTSPNINATPFKIKEYPESIYKEISPALGELSIEGKLARTVTPTLSAKKVTGQAIALLEPAIVTLEVTQKGPVAANETKYTASVSVPQLGTDYMVPIPNPPLFGEMVLELSLSESGKINSLKYGSVSGAENAGTSLSALHDHFGSQTDEEKAKELKAQADIMAQQQRIVICKATPSLCK